MKSLAALRPYFLRSKTYLISGLFFVAISNLFAVLPPVIVRTVIDRVTSEAASFSFFKNTGLEAAARGYVFSLVLWNGLLLLGLALLRGVFMFLMRQTLIVMSRHIEYAQKAAIYKHYQQLDAGFFKTHFTGDLMNRISEDVSRVRMYTGPALMYSVNMAVLTILCFWGMSRVDTRLTLLVIAPLPLLALAIYLVNKIIARKSEKIQSQLSDLTTTAQESYSGIRVIKSFVQETPMLRHFTQTAEAYRKSAVNLSLTESIWFPSMTFFIGLSLLLTVLAGGYLAIRGTASAGNIAEFVIYLNLLMFPISSLGWVASMIQRAAVSQTRINEFLHTPSAIQNPVSPLPIAIGIPTVRGEVDFKDARFVYPHTGIVALKDFNLHLAPGEKVCIIGKTGSGKSTVAQLLLRMYDPAGGTLRMDGIPLKDYDLHHLRRNIAYAPQEAYLFSDSIYNNIKFGRDEATHEEVLEAARLADLAKDVEGFPEGYETLIGERGVMLSGGQKQRLVLARALLKNAPVLLLDESLSAVDTQTEQRILSNLKEALKNTTVIVITHRLYAGWDFDKILVLDDGAVVESGTHATLLAQNGRYADLWRHQTGVNSD